MNKHSSELNLREFQIKLRIFTKQTRHSYQINIGKRTIWSPNNLAFSANFHESILVTLIFINKQIAHGSVLNLILEREKVRRINVKIVL